MSVRVTRARWDVAAKRGDPLSITPQYLPTLLRFFSHSWQENVRVALRWSTDITVARANNEERVALYTRPRREVFLSLAGLEFEQAREMRETVLRHCHERRLIPLLPDVTNLTGVAQDAQTFFCDTGGGRSFFPGGLVLVAELGKLGHPTTYGVGVIDAVTDSGFSTVDLISGDYSTNGGVAWPLIECEPATRADSVLPTSGPGAITTITLGEVQGPSALPPLVTPGNWPTLFDTYDQHPIAPAWAGIIDGQRSGVARAGSVGSVGRGTDVSLSGDRPRETWEVEIRALNRDQSHQALELIHYAQGRCNPFWCLGKIGLGLIAITEQTIDVALPTSMEEFERFFAGHVGIDYKDGRTNIYQVDSITEPSAGVARLSLNQKVPANRRDTAEAIVCAPAFLVRFNSDEIITEWPTAHTMFAAAPIIELHREGPVEILRANDTITRVYPGDLPDLIYWGGGTKYLPGTTTAAGSDGDDVETWLDVRGDTNEFQLKDKLTPFHEFYATETGLPIRALNLPSGGTDPTFFELDPLGKFWSDSLGLTIFALIKVRETDPTPGGFIILDTPDSGAVVWNPTKLELRNERNSAENTEFSVVTPDITLPRGEWNIVAMTWKPGRYARVYQHGILMGETNQAPTHLGELSPTSQPRVFVANNATADAFSSGDTMIRDVLIFRRSLEAEEIDRVGRWVQTSFDFAEIPGLAWQRIH